MNDLSRFVVSLMMVIGFCTVILLVRHQALLRRAATSQAQLTAVIGNTAYGNSFVLPMSFASTNPADLSADIVNITPLNADRLDLRATNIQLRVYSGHTPYFYQVFSNVWVIRFR